MSNNNQTTVNYISGLDIFRFIASLGVIFSHSFMEYQHFFDAYIVRICVRWIVPFFLIVTGYFLKEDFKAFRKYIVHIVIQYLFWVIFYALVFRYDIYSLKNLFSAVRSGLVIHLWYYPTLLICSVFVWILIKLVKKPSLIIAICSVLFVIAVIGHTLINIPAFDVINHSFLMRMHERIMGAPTTRDGVFWGSLYIAIGYAIRHAKNKDFFVIRSYPKFWLTFIPLFILTSLEEWAVVYFNTGEKDILIGTIPVAIMIFVLGMNLKMPKKTGEFLRDTGNAVYVTHYFFLNILIQMGMLSWRLFIPTVILTVATSMALTYFAQKYPKLHYIV